MDPDRFQMRDVKRRLTSLEKLCERQNQRIRDQNEVILGIFTDLQLITDKFGIVKSK